MQHRVSVRLICQYKDTILLISHSDRDYRSLPGGGIEANETIPQTIHRELYEETGYQLTNEQPTLLDAQIMQLGRTQENKRNTCQLYYHIPITKPFAVRNEEPHHNVYQRCTYKQIDKLIPPNGRQNKSLLLSLLVQNTQN